MARRHLALYGNVAIPRRYCESCRQWTLIVKGERTCCGKPEDSPLGKVRRMSNARNIRKRPSARVASELLLIQESKCYYCGQVFGEPVWRYGARVRLQVNFDHVEPYTYSQNNGQYNFVAACHVCNGWKSSKMFQSIDVAKDYLVRKWEANRWKKAGKKDLGNIVRLVDDSSSKLDPGKLIAAEPVNGEPGPSEIPE